MAQDNYTIEVATRILEAAGKALDPEGSPAEQARLVYGLAAGMVETQDDTHAIERLQQEASTRAVLAELVEALYATDDTAELTVSRSHPRLANAVMRARDIIGDLS